MFKVGDKVKLKDDICKAYDVPEYVGVCFIIDHTGVDYDFYRNKEELKFYCISEEDSMVRICGGSDLFEPYIDYSKLISFLTTLK